LLDKREGEGEARGGGVVAAMEEKEKQLVGREKCGSVYGGIGGWRWLWQEEGETFGWEQKGEVGREEREACGGSS
jgi:hypothetical protein